MKNNGKIKLSMLILEMSFYKKLKNQVIMEKICNASVDIYKTRKNLQTLISKILKVKKLKFAQFTFQTSKFQKPWD